MSKTIQIPFDAHGNPLSFPVGVAEWRDNFMFVDTLKYMGYQTGRSSVLYAFERRSNKQRVLVFLSDMDKLIPLMERGEIHGTFSFVKKGQNFGCAMLSDEQAKKMRKTLGEEPSAIEARVIDIVSWHLGQAADFVQLDHDMQDDLGGDSLDHVEIVMAVEEEYDIEVNDEDAGKFFNTTPRKIVEYLRMKLSA